MAHVYVAADMSVQNMPVCTLMLQIYGKWHMYMLQWICQYKTYAYTATDTSMLQIYGK